MKSLVRKGDLENILYSSAVVISTKYGTLGFFDFETNST
jgi:hypothetical protein